MIITTKELSDIIDTVKIGVDESSFGPILSIPDARDVTKKQLNSIPMGIFQVALGIVLTGFLQDRINASRADNLQESHKSTDNSAKPQ